MAEDGVESGDGEGRVKDTSVIDWRMGVRGNPRRE